MTTEFVTADKIVAGDTLVHPYTTWEVTEATVTAGYYTFKVIPSNPAYETRVSGFADAVFKRIKR